MVIKGDFGHKTTLYIRVYIYVHISYIFQANEEFDYNQGIENLPLTQIGCKYIFNNQVLKFCSSKIKVIQIILQMTKFYDTNMFETFRSSVINFIRVGILFIDK